MALITKDISEYLTRDNQEPDYVVKVQEVRFLGIPIYRKEFNSTNKEEISKFKTARAPKIGFN